MGQMLGAGQMKWSSDGDFLDQQHIHIGRMNTSKDAVVSSYFGSLPRQGG